VENKKNNDTGRDRERDRDGTNEKTGRRDEKGGGKKGHRREEGGREGGIRVRDPPICHPAANKAYDSCVLMRTRRAAAVSLRAANEIIVGIIQRNDPFS